MTTARFGWIVHKSAIASGNSTGPLEQAGRSGSRAPSAESPTVASVMKSKSAGTQEPNLIAGPRFGQIIWGRVWPKRFSLALVQASSVPIWKSTLRRAAGALSISSARAPTADGPKFGTLTIPNDVRVFIGAPEGRLQQTLLDSITHAVASIPDIIEAHLPQCFLPHVMSKPARVLVIVVPAYRAERILAALLDQLAAVLSPPFCLDVWPITTDSAVLAAVHGARCKIFDRSSAP